MTPAAAITVDERWIADWIAFGLQELDAYLAHHAAFAAYLARHPSRAYSVAEIAPMAQTGDDR